MNLHEVLTRYCYDVFNLYGNKLRVSELLLISRPTILKYTRTAKDMKMKKERKLYPEHIISMEMYKSRFILEIYLKNNKSIEETSKEIMACVEQVRRCLDNCKLYKLPGHEEINHNYAFEPLPKAIKECEGN